MDHRRTPTRRAVILPGWLIVGTVVVLIAAAAYLAYARLVDDSELIVNSPSASGSATPTSAAPSTEPPSVAPSPSPTTPSPTPSPSPSPSPTPTPAPEPVRDVPVVVFNNTGQSGLAASFADRARSAGWTVTGVDNWRGSIPQSTVYHPAGQQEAAERLAADLGLDRVRERVSPMPQDRLTVILSGAR